MIVSGALLAPFSVRAAPQQQPLLFDGTDDEVAVPHGADFGFSSAVTLEAWIRPLSLSSTTSQDRVVSKANGLELMVSTGDTGCAFSTSGHVQWRAKIAGLDRRICGGKLTLGQWYHIAGTYDGASFTLYVNGVRVASAARSGALNPGTGPFKIGNHPTSARNFDGGIDEVRIWNQGLSQAEIQSNKDHELTATEPGLVAYYDMNEGSGQILHDRTGRGHDGTLGFSPGTDTKDPAWAADSDSDPIWPGASWATATPEEMGLNRSLLINARDFALSAGGSGMVIRGGKLVMSWGDLKKRYDVKSTTKSMAGSTVLALALGDGRVTLDDLAQNALPAFGTPPNANLATGWLDDVTLRHLATHTAGFDKPGGFDDILFAPGTGWAYSDGGTNWLADVLTVRYGADLRSILFPRVFKRIGITDADATWRANTHRPDTINGIKRREFNAGISANVNAMARLGYLYLRGGNWKGEQLIPGSFIDLARAVVPNVQGLPVKNDLNKEYGGAPRHYGMLWWNNADGAMANVPRDAYWAWGLFDSLIVVVPSLDIVAARAGKTWAGKRTPSYYQVIERFIDPIARAAAPIQK